MGLMDFVIIGGALLFAVIGIVKGGAKIFFGLFMLLVIMVGASFISAAVCPLVLQKNTDEGVVYTSAAQTIMAPIANALPASGDFATLLDTEIVLGEDGVLYVGESGDIPLKSTISENIPVVGQYLASFIEKAAIPGTTLRSSIAYNIARYICEIILWVILVIALAIVRNIVRKKIFVFLDDKKHAVFSKIDRAIGAVITLVIFVALLWGAGVLIARFDDGANWAYKADAFLLDGVIAKPFMQANPLLKLINVTLPVAEAA
ncbi:MAG: hypothetical protein J6Y74_05995 [Clostridia bacterium]|nr:hypothetical protein [Clostridia bacterium]